MSRHTATLTTNYIAVECTIGKTNYRYIVIAYSFYPSIYLTPDTPDRSCGTNQVLHLIQSRYLDCCIYNKHTIWQRTGPHVVENVNFWCIKATVVPWPDRERKVKPINAVIWNLSSWIYLTVLMKVMSEMLHKRFLFYFFFLSSQREIKSCSFSHPGSLVVCWRCSLIQVALCIRDMRWMCLHRPNREGRNLMNALSCLSFYDSCILLWEGKSPINKYRCRNKSSTTVFSGAGIITPSPRYLPCIQY